MGKNVLGEDCEFRFPDLLNCSSSWTLLEKIIRMEVKAPITFTEAALLAQEQYLALIRMNKYGSDPDQCSYTDSFTEWISSLGYHIELTGDEFEHFFVGVPTV